MTSLAERLALKISESRTSDLSLNSIRERVWDDGDVPLWDMDDTEMNQLVIDTHYAVHHKVIIKMEEK